ncbi:MULTISPECIES: hypothetical protein [unclassified Streptomyces]|uniref:hypothetical protein n=1 Tax=unclassified Streptomyces TaxID=2593676 RepID=UPI001BE66B95|nr:MULTISPECIES: hypothetical protein [unclassified Streptomyces]MBT2407029.1 hypothetical protein [Streptomyces sp. ISL-21]MBT2454603.1 hypothetical protein [Streptomyces sp. ISL-86]MBT2611780.1 hypothetical protein [Streptomyces sp. ISL-87]
MAPSLLTNRGYTSGILVAVVFFASFTGLMLVLSLFLQGPLGLSPEGAGINAVQQLANAVGVALLVTVWSAFTEHGRPPSAALSGTALVTVALLAAALVLSTRLPRHARA